MCPHVYPHSRSTSRLTSEHGREKGREQRMCPRDRSGGDGDAGSVIIFSVQDVSGDGRFDEVSHVAIEASSPKWRGTTQ